MADTTINVNSGFYNAINDDRTYYAEDMNKPYKRVVANGVFATPKGTPSTDLQVTAGSGMTVIVAPGEGIFGDKWFENPAAVTFNVPTVALGRIRYDSVIAQVDTRTTGRVASIVYRTGVAGTSGNITWPAINQTAGVYEYRLANITVTPNAGTVGLASAIYDTRGTAECPWVTSLIQQVDTDALWTQYRSAFAQLLADFEEDWTVHLQNAEDDWAAFLGQASTDLTVTPNILQLRSSYVAQSAVSTVPIGIPSFDKTTDLLIVFINGFMATQDTYWTLDESGTSITLPDPLEIGDRIDFLVMKSVITATLSSVTGAIQDLEDLVNSAIADTGWSSDGVTFVNGGPNVEGVLPQLRKIGNTVYMRGNFKGATTTGNVFTIPLAYSPRNRDHHFTAAAQDGATCSGPILMRIGYRGSDAEGTVAISAFNTAIGENDLVYVDTCWTI